MTTAQWVLLATLAASCYDTGTIWMVQTGYRLWTYVSPADFGAYHSAWWVKIIPVIFPVAGLGLLGSIALVWQCPDGVSPVLVWTNLGVKLGTVALTIAVWGRWQANTHFARLADGSLDPVYANIMKTHWIRVMLITIQGLLVLWIMVAHLSLRQRALVR